MWAHAKVENTTGKEDCSFEIIQTGSPQAVNTGSLIGRKPTSQVND
jgi:hypothetical protein